MTILETLLQITVGSAVIFGVIAAVKAIFREKISPVLHYAIWGIFLLRLILPITLESPVHFFTLPAEESAAQEIIIQQAPIVGEGDHEQVIVQEETPLQESTPAEESIVSEQMVQENTYPQETEKTENVAVQQEEAPIQQNAVQEAPQRRKIQLTAKQIITGIWLIGVVFGLGYIAAGYLLMRRKIRNSRVHTPQSLRTIYSEVCEEMNIRRDIPLICVYGFTSPGLMFPGDVVVPIEKLTSLSDESVRLILRHELMHYKRGDQVVCLLLAVLNAIYWFNPLVWLAAAWMRRDMETACDSEVVMGMQADEKRSYAALIIELLSRSGHTAAMLGMAEGGVKTAKRRIRGIFMKKNSHFTAKLTAGIMAVLLLVCCFTTACQPVEKKAADKIDHYKDTISVRDGSFVLDIDADVISAERETWPVYITMLHQYTAKDPREMMKTLAPKGKLYYTDKEEDKQYYQAWIEEYEKILADIRAGKMSLEYDFEEYDSDEEMIESRIKNLTDMKNKAPEKTEYVLWGAEDDDLMPKEFTRVFADTENDPSFEVQNGTFESCMNYSNDLNGTADILSISGDKSYGLFELYPETDEYEVAVKMTEEEAIKEAEKYIKKLGFEDMGFEGTVKPYGDYKEGEFMQGTRQLAYGVVFTRKMNDIPQAHLLDDAIVMDETGVYTAATEKESLVVVVGDDGLWELDWKNREFVERVEYNDREILRFEELSHELIAAAAEACSLSTKVVRDEIYANRDVKKKITEIRLSYAKTRVEGAYDDYHTVPAWVFYTEDGEALFAINALKMNEEAQTATVLEDDILNVLLLGIDTTPERRKQDMSMRSDTMILCSVNPDRETVSMISFPRDLYAEIYSIEGEMIGENRINAAYAKDGTMAAANTLEQMIRSKSGIKMEIDHYVCMNMESLQQFAKAVGDVSVTLRTDFPEIGSKGDTVTVNEKNIDRFLRERKMTGGDYSRMERQQDYLIAALKTAKLGKEDLKEKFSAIMSAAANIEIETNLELKQVKEIAEVLKKTDAEDILCYTPETRGAVTDSGAAVLELKEAEFRERMQQIFTVPAEETAANVQQLNGIEWKESFTVGSTKWNVDVVTEAVNAAEYPVYKVSNKNFTTDEANFYLDRLTQGAVSMRGAYTTKEDYEHYIAGYESLIKGGSRYSADLKVQIKEWKEELKTAEPERFGEVGPIKGNTELIGETTTNAATIKPEATSEITEPFVAEARRRVYRFADGTKREVFISDDWLSFDDLEYMSFQPESWTVDGEALEGEPEGTLVEGVTMTQEEAVAQAEKLLTELELTDFELASAEKARVFDSYSHEIYTDKAGWWLRFYNTMGKAAAADMDPQEYIGIQHNEEYKKLSESLTDEDDEIRIHQECITMIVNQDGVEYFDWRNVNEIHGEQESVKLMSVEEAKETLKENMKTMRDIHHTNEICSMKLAYVKMYDEESAEYDLLRPAWVFGVRSEVDLTKYAMEQVIAMDAETGKLVEPNFSVYHSDLYNFYN